MKKSLKIAGGLLFTLSAVIAVRTATFKPAGVADATGVKLAEAPEIDVQVAANHLSEAIRFRTISHQDAAENQPAEWQKFQAWLKATYPQAHASMALEIAGNGTLLYHWQGRDPAAKPIILLAHQDVVPVTPGTEKDWKHAPFAGDIAENAVWGRGAIDDKGSLIALFEALEAIAAKGFSPQRSVYIISGHDEEVGGDGAKAAVDLLIAKGVKALFSIDEGSAVIADAPMINNPAILIGVAEKGYATIKVEAPSTGGHSSMPPAAKDIGTVTLAKALLAINQRQFPNKLHGAPAGMVEVLAERAGGVNKALVANRWLFGGTVERSMAASPTSAAMLHTTIAPTMLTGSPKENVLPQSATAMINFRIAPGDTRESVLKWVQTSVDGLPVRLSIEGHSSDPSPVSSTSSVGWILIRAAAEAEVPDAPVAPFLVVAGTDSKHVAPIVDDAYRFSPMVVKSAETKMIHGTNEHMTLDNFARMVRFYARLIATAAG